MHKRSEKLRPGTSGMFRQTALHLLHLIPVARLNHQPPYQRAKLGDDQLPVPFDQRGEDRAPPQPQQAADTFWYQQRLHPAQNMVTPLAQVPAVLTVEERGVSAVVEVSHEVESPVGPPLLVTYRQRLDVQSFSDAPEDKVEFFALSGRERAVEHAVCSLGVVYEHVEHVPEGPVGDTLPALALDRAVDRVDPGERPLRRLPLREHDLLRVADRGEQTPDGVGWYLAREEEPIDRPVQSELGG